MYITYSQNENYPETYDLTIHTDSIPRVDTQPIHTEDGTTFWYGEDNRGFVNFGISYDKPHMGHQPGYMWSSRASVFNGLFSKCCKEVTIYDGKYRYSSAMTLEAIFELLDEDHELAIYKDLQEAELYLEVCDKHSVPDYLYGRGYLVDTFCK